jgi:hypothetical protein
VQSISLHPLGMGGFETACMRVLPGGGPVMVLLKNDG